MDPNKLVQGKVYFNCGYENPGKPIPQIQALVYLGKNLSKNEKAGGDEYWFQNPQIFFIDDVKDQNIREEILKSVEASGKIIIPHDCVDMVKSYDELLSWLQMLRQSDDFDAVY
jgi:hypothetical protein